MRPVKILVFLFLSSLLLTAQNKNENGKAQRYKAEILSAIEELEVVKPTEKRKMLVCSITNGYRHKSIPTGQLAFQLMGEKTGAYEVVVSNDLEHFQPEKIAEFDAICFLNTTSEIFSPSKREMKKLSEEELKEWEVREKALKESLMAHIKSGKGFIGIHSATDTFYKWPEYGEMTGAYFAGHPWNAGTEVNIIVPEKVQKNLIVKHLNGENLIFKEEIYQFKEENVSGGAEVLMKLDPHRNSFEKSKRKESKNIPISWTKAHDKGRVFYSSLGHNDHIFYDPKILQHFLSGIQWALGDLSKE